MKVELLYIEDCPNSDEAYARLRAAVSDVAGPGIDVVRTVVLDATGAPAFAGSPTITLDGVDLFPGATPVNELSCRIYQTPDGLAGLPTQEQIKKSLQNRGVSPGRRRMAS
ncbi:thioredoxin family protein [Pseudarthrobacter sulfonivorans]|uniref:thioredoxin family protein n=1 Tax=Pseudarthrobacter sulfonivorans TaxID=121292 RepID=UPI0021073B4C|nr:thioredoxin family protein [Pseudarthrobacter sulfonivorans]